MNYMLQPEGRTAQSVMSGAGCTKLRWKEIKSLSIHPTPLLESATDQYSMAGAGKNAGYK